MILNIKNLILLTSLLMLVACAQKKAVLRPPNFIIFIADDAAWNDSGAYGNNAIQTPTINRLAQEGMVFTNAFVTTSSCSPSRCSIMTGMYPHNTGAPELHMPLPDDRALFAGELQKAGYYTVSAGKWHLGPPRNEFDSIYAVRDPSGAIDWVRAIKNRPKGKPFFLWLASIDPHRPYEENIIPHPHDPARVIVPPYLPDNDSTRKDMALYYDEIARLDSNMEKVLEELDRQGETDNTVIIYMSDNGRPFPGCKTRMLDDGLKTPFIVRWPNQVKPGSVSQSLVSSIDIAPTFCALAHIDPIPQFQGVSFATVLEDPVKEVRDHVIGEHNWHDYQAHERAVRTKDFLYIRNAFPELNASPPADAVRSITYQEMIRLYHNRELQDQFMDCFVAPRPAEELYEVESDPYDSKNIIHDQAYRQKLLEMRKILDQWIEQTNDSIQAIPTPDMFDRFTGDKLMDIQQYRAKK